MNDWDKIVLKSKNPNVLLMLSGGKDSIASLIKLKEKNINVTAIHFIHQWGSDIPTNEAKRICNEFQVPLIIVDYTKEFFDIVNGYTNGRPCLICKKKMYEKLLSIINKKEFGWICIGDNSDDRTTIARINTYISDLMLEETLECSSYLGSEMGIQLPLGVKVLRPLISMSAIDVENFLKSKKVIVRRINSTGDKYFEYHREGCAMQFVDIGAKFSKELCDSLKKYNDIITEFARSKGILASIHMPSTFIITIPKGYEEEAASYLKLRGLYVDTYKNNSTLKYTNLFYAYIDEIDNSIYETNAYEKIVTRMMERLEFNIDDINKKEIDNFIHIQAKMENAFLQFELDFTRLVANITYEFNNNSLSRKEEYIFENLILELFRTRKYRIMIDTKE